MQEVFHAPRRVIRPSSLGQRGRDVEAGGAGPHVCVEPFRLSRRDLHRAAARPRRRSTMPIRIVLALPVAAI